MDRDNFFCLILGKAGESGQRNMEFREKRNLANSDLSLPQLAPSETMVCDHALNLPLGAENPMHEEFSVSGAPFLDLVSQTPRPSLVAHDCGYPLSRYTCRATRVAADFLDFIAFCRCSSGITPHPLEILVSHPPPPPHSREVSHRNLGLKTCRATRGCRRYSCGCRATLCN